jgi:hypothetical protein
VESVTVIGNSQCEACPASSNTEIVFPAILLRKALLVENAYLLQNGSLNEEAQPVQERNLRESSQRTFFDNSGDFFDGDLPRQGLTAQSPFPPLTSGTDCQLAAWTMDPRCAETHIFLFELAYHLLIAIQKTLLNQKVHTSWETVREILSTHHINTVVLPTSSGDFLRIRKGSTPEPEVREL